MKIVNSIYNFHARKSVDWLYSGHTTPITLGAACRHRPIDENEADNASQPSS